ncbi:Gfo/Idh/MocA family protein [Propylenella binzhouense]|uniref:Gfo/Idh/MocA family oxidoreductase n=1 Tax=Propylenella binzhouense TaxID=2555902 RepID=A0A964WV35_9HYPH|nr:Gfo/Idh/MocA family oxidoreductase [Propylenella binzhouense]MYZ49460.1 Gfo/Idh/MocA family oxidoreductase [Propylenella binzhouense]
MITCAVAGFGWWGRHISQRLAQAKALRLGYVVEPSPARAAEAAGEGYRTVASLDAALADPAIDAVILTTPNTLHEAQVAAAAAAGKHVFCEKPLGLDGASAARSVAACRAAGVVLGIGHERRFEPAMQEIARLVRDGALGTVMHAESAFSHDKLIGVPEGDWRRMSASAPAAGMTGMGIHLTDLYIWMFGRVATVSALTADRVLGWETGDVVTVQLGFEAGMTATLSAVLKTPHYMRYQVLGSDAWAEARNETHPDTPGGRTHFVLQRSGGAGPETRTFDWNDAVLANLEAFAAAIEGRAAYPYTNAEKIHNIEVLEAVTRSARDLAVVRLP